MRMQNIVLITLLSLLYRTKVVCSGGGGSRDFYFCGWDNADLLRLKGDAMIIAAELLDSASWRVQSAAKASSMYEGELGPESADIPRAAIRIAKEVEDAVKEAEKVKKTKTVVKNMTPIMQEQYNSDIVERTTYLFKVAEGLKRAALFLNDLDKKMFTEQALRDATQAKFYTDKAVHRMERCQLKKEPEEPHKRYGNQYKSYF